MMTDIPFGIAEIDGEPVTVAELTLPEVTALVSFLPNHGLVFDMIRNLDFSGKISLNSDSTEQDISLLTSALQDGYSPDEEELQAASHTLTRWVSSVVPIGITSLTDKGLILGNDGAYKTHRSLDGIIRILKNPIEHMAYKTSQVPVDENEAKPILRSSLYAVQGFVGDWLIAEHFQSQDYIRFFCIPSGSSLSSKIGSIVLDGVKKSISSNLFSRSGSEYRPFSVLLARTNEHGAQLVAGAQSRMEGENLNWYTPYPIENGSVLGEFESKFGNAFSTEGRVAEMTLLAYNQLDIRNGLDDWSLVGSNEVLLDGVEKMTKMTLHSQADHLPDTIPDFFFED